MIMSSHQAEKSIINHFSHPHPLHFFSNHQSSSLTNIPIICSGCKSQASSGTIYSCITCNYFLHANCAKMPQQITHPFDNKAHVLTLHPKPPYSDCFCDACGKPGQGFCYHCKICNIDLHILCAAMPLTFTHQSHPHQLKLLFSPTHFNKQFNCDVCNTLGSNHWLYRCDICDFDVHLNCKNVPVQAVKQQQANIHHQPHHQTNFSAFPNQTPVPQAHTFQHPGFAIHKSAPPQVPCPPAPAAHFPPYHHPQYTATGIPVHHQGMDPAVVAFIQRLQAQTAAQNRLNQQQLQALLAGGGVGGFGSGRTGGGFGGIQNLVEALSGAGNGIGNGIGGNIPGLDFLGNGGGGQNLLQSLWGGGDGGLSLLNGLDLGSLLGGFIS